AVAAGRPAEAGTLDEARLPEGEETEFWRGLRQAAQGRGAASAPAVAVGVPLLLAFPEALRTRLLPAVAEALEEAGEWQALRRLAEAQPDVPALRLARARIAEGEGRAEEALALHAGIGAGQDRPARARALRRAVELRLARGELDAAGAAAALDRLLYAWRGEAEEFRQRLRIAELHRAARAPRAAFAMLEETARLFPDRAPMLQPLMAEALTAAIAAESPLTAVALHEAHGALLVGGMADSTALTLADRLAALDLVDQAARLLNAAMARSGDAVSRAALGLRLAALRLGEADAAGVLDALGASDTESMPDALRQERRRLAARAFAMRGEADRAEAILEALEEAGAVPLAELRAARRDWAGAAAALRRHLGATLPPEPASLDAAQRQDITRLAAYLALAGDDPALATLRTELGGRMGEGPLADGFAALTADPMRGSADLPRLARELDALRILPARLEALRNPPELTR
ncbi:MAG TPA: hypothetical protein VD970_01415, partial [Acetobacteraceae bacterium]|nr:hypothetical protein [Acetobacteraceae bacterium]